MWFLNFFTIDQSYYTLRKFKQISTPYTLYNYFLNSKVFEISVKCIAFYTKARYSLSNVLRLYLNNYSRYSLIRNSLIRKSTYPEWIANEHYFFQWQLISGFYLITEAYSLIIKKPILKVSAYKYGLSFGRLLLFESSILNG